MTGQPNRPVGVLGVDIGGTKVAVAAADREGHLLGRATRATTAGDGAEAALGRIFEAIDAACAEAGIARPEALGVGAPGISVLGGPNLLCPNIPGWAELDLFSRFGARYGCPLAIRNDIKTAALGEGWRGAAQGARSWIYVGIGTGIAAGIVVDGQLWEGAHGAAGEIGYWTPSMQRSADALRAGQPLPSYSGGHCPLEEIVAGRAVGERATALVAAGGAPLLRQIGAADGTVTARMLFEAAAAGDAAARDLADDVAYLLGVALAHLVIVTDPELLVIGGGLSGAGAPLLGPIERAMAELTPFPPRVIFSTLGGDSGLYGAVRLALDLWPNG